MAMELVAAGEKAPFCVWAKSQTAGRGRRGRVWLEAEGNLYLTIAVPSKDIHLHERGLLPVAVATILVEWLMVTYGIQPRIKWPNDIIFGGSKLAGILCESSIQGSEWSDTFIGIGLNLNSLPPGPLDYRGMTVCELIGKEVVDVEAVARGFAAFFASRLHGLMDDDVRAAFGRYGIHSGLPWRDDSSHSGIHVNGAIQSGGGLEFYNSAGQGPYTVSSVQHDLRCLYFSAEAPRPFWAVDVGNTAVKIAVFPDHQSSQQMRQHSLDYGNLSEGSLRQTIESFDVSSGEMPGVWPIYVASVNPHGSDRVMGMLAAVGFYPITVEKKPVYRLRNGGYALPDLGIDRLALIESWLGKVRAMASASRPKAGIVVSAGTATTIDVVEATGLHWSGNILPGLGTALDALADKTALLPRINLQRYESLPPLGLNTSTAMVRGVVDMTVGAIEQALGNLLAETGWLRAEVSVVISGGLGKFLRHELSLDEPEISVLDGVRIIVTGS